MKDDIWDNENLIKVLDKNGIAVMPTDTIYGIVGKALEKNTVERIYSIKKRDPEKPCIILIGDTKELKKFSVVLSEEQKMVLEKYWSFDSTQDFQPRPTSIVLDCLDNSFSYLHRGTKTLAFRVPTPDALRGLLFKVGPLIAPSANKETFSPNETIKDAEKYFGNSVDLYIDGGELKGKSSKLIKLSKDGSVSVLRD